MNYDREIIKSSKIGEQYFKIKHPSGCTICLYPMEGFSSIYAVFGVNYGSLDTAFKTDSGSDFVTAPMGVAHFLEHKLFEDPNELFAKTGAKANAYTGFDKTTYLFYCSQKFEENLEILLSSVQKPHFTDESVEKEKGIIEQEIAMYEDDPRWQVYFNGYRAAYHSHLIKEPIAGTKESVAVIDKETLYRCYNTFYSLDNSILSIAGNFDPDKALEICDRLLKPVPLDKIGKIERYTPSEPYEVKEKTVKAKLSCSKPMFQIIYKFPEMTPQEAQRKYDEYTVMLDLCLGGSSPFYTEMYEQGLIDDTFGASAGYLRGLFMCVISGDSDNPELLLSKINAELTRLKKDPPSREMFESIKKSTYGAMLRNYGYVDMVSNSLLNAEMMGVTAFDGIDIISLLTYEDVIGALREIDLDNCSISIAEPC